MLRQHIIDIFIYLYIQPFSKTLQFENNICEIYIPIYLYIHLFILSFPMTKVSGPSDIFSINALLRNLALLRLARLVLTPSQHHSFFRNLPLHSLVLTPNYFSFGGNYFKQTSGVAMGTKMGISLVRSSFQTNDQPRTWLCPRVPVHKGRKH